jgi:hypothetical protein
MRRHSSVALAYRDALFWVRPCLPCCDPNYPILLVAVLNDERFNAWITEMTASSEVDATLTAHGWVAQEPGGPR